MDQESKKSYVNGDEYTNKLLENTKTVFDRNHVTLLLELPTEDLPLIYNYYAQYDVKKRLRKASRKLSKDETLPIPNQAFDGVFRVFNPVVRARNQISKLSNSLKTLRDQEKELVKLYPSNSARPQTIELAINALAASVYTKGGNLDGFEIREWATTWGPRIKAS